MAVTAALLAVAWCIGPPAAAEAKGGVVALGLQLADLLKATSQWLPALLLLFAARTPQAFLSSALAVDLFSGDLFSEDSGVPAWLAERPSGGQRLALAMALLLWRADKLTSLLERMKRFAAEPNKTFGVQATVWAMVRRMALLLVSCCGCGPFVQLALPAVLLDECLWFFVAQVQERCGGGADASGVVDTVVLPLFDLAHFVPVLLRVVCLMLFVYPDSRWPVLLTGGAAAWTGHNLHVLKVGREDIALAWSTWLGSRH